jgi:class 3 adenylate cyclase
MTADGASAHWTSERVARRLTAILAADVAGYSRLMGADEEGTLAQLKAHRRALVDPKITEHRGRIVKTPGDGMLSSSPTWWTPCPVPSRSNAVSSRSALLSAEKLAAGSKEPARAAGAIPGVPFDAHGLRANVIPLDGLGASADEKASRSRY